MLSAALTRLQPSESWKIIVLFGDICTFCIRESSICVFHEHQCIMIYSYDSYALNDPCSNGIYDFSDISSKNVDDWVKQNQLHCPYAVDSMKWSLRRRCKQIPSDGSVVFLWEKQRVEGEQKINVHDGMWTPCSALFLDPFWSFSQLHDNTHSIIVLQKSWLLGEPGKLQNLNQKLHINFALCLIDRLHQLLLTLESSKIQKKNGQVSHLTGAV